MDNDFGEFEEIKDESATPTTEQQMPTRVRIPRNNEKIGVVMQRLGGKRMHVKDTEGKIRNCRVPGRFERKLWLRPKDIVLVVPWEDDDEKGDVIYKYSSSEINQLRKKGIMAKLDIGF